MIEIKVRYSQSDLAALTAEAVALGVPRAQLVRDRSLSRALAGMTTMDYNALVAGAVRQMHGDIPRGKIEHLVAYVINQTAANSRTAPCSIDRSPRSRSCNP